MSTKVDILALATRFAGIPVDAVLLAEDFDDVVLSLDAIEFLVAITLLEHASGDAVFHCPPASLRLLAVWYDDRQLSHAAMTALEAVTPRWRDDAGTPHSWISETEGDRFVRLYPAPDAPSQPNTFAHGLPFGIDFPRGAVSVACTEARTDLPDWLDLPVSLAMLARHFAREERYRDPTFAATMRRVADRLLHLVG